MVIEMSSNSDVDSFVKHSSNSNTYVGHNVISIKNSCTALVEHNIISNY